MRWKQLTMCSRCTVSETDNIINGTSRQFYVHVTVHHNKFLYNKTNRCTNFPNLLWLKMNLYMFRAVSLPIIRNSCTVHMALVYVIQVERQISSRAIPALLEKLSSNLYDIYQCQVYSA